MEKSVPTEPNRPAADRWFYTSATGLLLVLTVAGFHHFYLHGRASPGREITPPIRGLVLTHGALMTIWLLLARAQPWLVATRNVKLHRRLGLFGAGLAIVMVVVGLRIAVASAAVTPPGVMLGPPTDFFVRHGWYGVFGDFCAVVAHGARTRHFDRRLAAGFAAFAVACTAIAQAATSASWAAVADVLLR